MVSGDPAVIQGHLYLNGRPVKSYCLAVSGQKLVQMPDGRLKIMNKHETHNGTSDSLLSTTSNNNCDSLNMPQLTSKYIFIILLFIIINDVFSVLLLS